MKLTRRQFFKGLAAGATVVGTAKVMPGFIEVEELWKPKTISIPKSTLIYDIGGKFAYDYKAKTIRYVGDPKSGATVVELHRWLQNLADDRMFGTEDDELCILDTNPSIRVTDQIITLENDWYVENPEYLKNGSIEQRGEYWTGLKTVGTIEEDTVPLINGKPAIRSGHVNQCIKVEPGEAVTVSTMTPGKTYSRFDIKTHTRGVNIGALAEMDDLSWDNPYSDPLYDVFKDMKPDKFKTMNTTKAQRVAWKGKI